MKDEPFRIRIPAKPFQSHEQFPGGFLIPRPRQSHEIVEMEPGKSLVLPSPQTVRSIAIHKDEKGDLYLDLES